MTITRADRCADEPPEGSAAEVTLRHFSQSDACPSVRASARDEVIWRRPRKADRPRCGAKCRDGHACRAPVVTDRWPDGTVRLRKRCRMHGGLSTGPKTAEGRARQIAAVREYWRRWRAARAASA